MIYGGSRSDIKQANLKVIAYTYRSYIDQKIREVKRLNNLIKVCYNEETVSSLRLSREKILDHIFSLGSQHNIVKIYLCQNLGIDYKALSKLKNQQSILVIKSKEIYLKLSSV